MADDNSKAGLYAKMAQVMAEISSIPKTGKNDHFKYKFVTADAVADKVRDLLSSKGIAFFASITGRELVEVRKGSEKTDPNTGEMTKLVSVNSRWVVEFEFTFADSESGAAVTQKWLAEADSADDKGINKCATAAEKYFLLKTFIVSSADEPDADADGGKKRPQGTQSANKPQPPQQQQQNAPAPVSGGQTRPLATTPPTAPISANVGSSAGAEFFPPEAVVLPLNTEGDSDHLPRDVNGLPILGSLDMKALGKLAQGEGLVTGQRRFANLIDVLWREGSIRAASKPEAVMEAIRNHYAMRDLEKETADAR